MSEQYPIAGESAPVRVVHNEPLSVSVEWMLTDDDLARLREGVVFHHVAEWGGRVFVIALRDVTGEE